MRRGLNPAIANLRDVDKTLLEDMIDGTMTTSHPQYSTTLLIYQMLNNAVRQMVERQMVERHIQDDKFIIQITRSVMKSLIAKYTNKIISHKQIKDEVVDKVNLFPFLESKNARRAATKVVKKRKVYRGMSGGLYELRRSKVTGKMYKKYLGSRNSN